ncbi:MAG: hypothetical protein JW830_13245 [Bacteroidales bacterium]|nr:hypothetical protein [Bacteroidales bacterium]
MISYKFKYVGWAFFLVGLTLTVLNQIQRIKIKMPVLAVHSSYIQTKYFAVITTNVFEEITLICFLAGFLLTIFSKEKVELQEYKTLREESWRIAIFLNSAMLAFSIIFIYGRGFAAVLILNMFSTFVFYIAVFLVKKARLKKSKD